MGSPRACMLTGQPETALDLNAAVAVGAGLLSLLATAHRAYGHRGLFGAAVVGLTVPMSWGLTAHSGPEAFIFFAIAFVLFASTFSNTSQVGTGLGITALTWGLLSWTYGFILWLAWFVLEAHSAYIGS